jgi:hypothetical protein
MQRAASAGLPLDGGVSEGNRSPSRVAVTCSLRVVRYARPCLNFVYGLPAVFCSTRAEVVEEFCHFRIR